MKYKVTKLDRRMNGWTFYKYSVAPHIIGGNECIAAFIELRNWCWEQYGPSCELKWANRSERWCWDTEYDKQRIYFKTDDELALFSLKFS